MDARCDKCGKPVTMTDLDLAPIHRTEANYWRAKYLEACLELRKANRGLRRLGAKLQRRKDEHP